MTKEKKWDFVSAAVCALIAGYAIYLTLTTFVTDQAAGGGPFANSAFYPQLLAGVIIFLSIILGLSSFVKKGEDSGDQASLAEGAVDFMEQGQAEEETTQQSVSGKLLVIFAMAQIIYTIFIDIVGYILLTPFFMAVMFWLLKIRNWILIAVLSLASTFTLYYFFFPVAGCYPSSGSLLVSVRKQ